MKESYLVFFIFLLFSSTGIAQKQITIDFQNQTGEIKDLCGVNRGPGHRNAGYAYAGVSEIRTHDYHHAFDYVMYSRFWNFDSVTMEFTTINEDFDPDNQAHYNWFSTDSALNEFESMGVDAYFRLGTSYPNEQYVIQPNNPPLDPDGIHFSNFAELCRRTVMHCNGDWDNGLNMNIRYWEIWNEPEGLFWNGSPLQFYQMYKAARESIKDYDPELMVGALSALPTTTLEMDTTYSSAFFSWLLDNNLSLDFYSWHIYGIQNPYALMDFGQKMRANLDTHGFSNAESHVAEINNYLEPWLPQFTDSPEGCAYYASHYITAQMAPIDKLFWYSGVGFFQYDTAGMPNLTWGAYAMKSFSHLRDETPIQIFSHGNEVVEGYWETDTTNFMALAGKSADQKKVYVMVSNYNSYNSNYTVEIQNLPWGPEDEIRITRNIIKGPDDKFTEITSYLPGSSTMNVLINDMPAPSVLLLRVERIGFVGVAKNTCTGFVVYPNPAGEVLYINRQVLYSGQDYAKDHLLVVDVNGRVMYQASLKNVHSEGNEIIELDISSLPGGIYYIILRSNEYRYLKKIIKM